MSGSNTNVLMAKLPRMTSPLGAHWRQPKTLRDRVTVYETHATIPEADWFGLHRYETTTPSGVYPGKAWRCGGFLCWYGPEVSGRCRIACVRALVQ